MDLNIAYGFILVDMVFIVGFVIKQQENYNQIFDKLLLNIFNFYYCMRNFYYLFIYLEWKRCIKRCNTSFSITSITSVNKIKNKKHNVKFIFTIKFRHACEIILTEFVDYECLEQVFLVDDQRIERFL